ncbi:hypothetical protein [Flavobacterium sp. NRK F7]|uniref:hypothetical protein n=1 Tax=Flavobacterium sp. NRK F7 TaxID=2954930 RepID=UPI0020904DF3|nr:hypothetical protein [Flavobacterium sp. NRK F7]MCO6163033.1 hypothetical protein [Flavobacterium sp. NRK F7]
MKQLYLGILVLFLSSCNQKEAATEKQEEEAFKMYEFSEMAGLMEQFYAENNKLKQQIVNGDTLGSFPSYFASIHTVDLTTASDRDAFFNEQAQKFIEAEQLIFTDSLNRKEHFNAAIDACIACHQQKCLGPIPRIKKLYIQ